MIKSNGGIIGPDNVTTGGAFGSASGVFKLGEVTNLIKESKWPTAGPQGFQVANSCRFNSGSSDTLNRTPSGASNRKTFTISFWVKRAKIGSRQSIFNNTDSGGQDGVYFDFQADDTFLFNDYGAGSYLTPRFETTQVFRDTSAWYHIVYAVDTTQGTESNRVKIYVNGNQVTNFDVANYPSQNQDTLWNRADTIYIGTYTAGGNYLGAYLSEVINIDGQQLTPTSFGEFNSQTGIWVPKVVTGLTFGTNGFYLPFTNSGALGEDFSGNDNDFSVNNLTSLDQSTDTCSTNFVTFNSLDNYQQQGTYTNGNIVYQTNTSNFTYNSSTIGVSTGKWYWEIEYDAKSGGTDQPMIGITSTQPTNTDQELGNFANDYAWYTDNSTGYLSNNNTYSNAGFNAYTVGDVISVALDLDNNKLYFAKNGTWEKSGDPESGSTGTGAISITAPVSTPLGTYFPSVAFGTGSYNGTFKANFGSPMYAISSGNADQNGFGNFEYAPPAGYLSINTKNLAAVLA